MFPFCVQTLARQWMQFTRQTSVAVWTNFFLREGGSPTIPWYPAVTCSGRGSAKVDLLGDEFRNMSSFSVRCLIPWWIHALRQFTEALTNLTHFLRACGLRTLARCLGGYMLRLSEAEFHTFPCESGFGLWEVPPDSHLNPRIRCTHSRSWINTVVKYRVGTTTTTTKHEQTRLTTPMCRPLSFVSSG